MSGATPVTSLGVCGIDCRRFASTPTQPARAPGVNQWLFRHLENARR